MSSSVCFGDNTIDRYLEPIGLDLIGGSCLNVAVGLAQRGVAAVYVGPVGDDEAGAQVLAELAAQGVDSGQVAVVPDSATAVTEILSLPDGDRKFVSESYEIFETYEPDSAAWASVIAARARPHELPSAPLRSAAGCGSQSRLPRLLRLLNRGAADRPGGSRTGLSLGRGNPPMSSMA